MLFLINHVVSFSNKVFYFLKPGYPKLYGLYGLFFSLTDGCQNKTQHVASVSWVYHAIIKYLPAGKKSISLAFKIINNGLFLTRQLFLIHRLTYTFHLVAYNGFQSIGSLLSPHNCSTR